VRAAIEDPLAAHEGGLDDAVERGARVRRELVAVLDAGGRHGEPLLGPPDDEVADGWLPFGLRRANLDRCMNWLETGFARAGAGKSRADFEIQGGVTVTITDDLRAAFDAAKPFVALYVGGMGHPTLNFHKKRMEREGYPEAAGRIHELFQAGKRAEAIAAVPDEYIDEGGLFGPVQRIRERWRSDWEGLPYTGLTVRTGQDEAYTLMAELVGARDARPEARDA
jgi:alkanesulfonate monooxygenase SsuD/methylene tetrahydromethanopterin reductase-like flavin-dependent oxidoreductase (luciferase family)